MHNKSNYQNFTILVNETFFCWCSRPITTDTELNLCVCLTYIYFIFILVYRLLFLSAGLFLSGISWRRCTDGRELLHGGRYVSWTCPGLFSLPYTTRSSNIKSFNILTRETHLDTPKDIATKRDVSSSLLVGISLGVSKWVSRVSMLKDLIFDERVVYGKEKSFICHRSSLSSGHATPF